MRPERRPEPTPNWKLVSCLIAVLAMSLGTVATGWARVVGSAAGEVPAAWRTPAEVAGYEATPSYEETLAFLRRVGERLPELRLERFGTTAAGRPMTVAILSAERAFAPAAAHALGKPVVLIENGIHAGEIDGKDAFLELVRDWALGRRRELLAGATLLVVPVYNVDGHERVSPFHRPNQNGPERGMGFRTTADGHDLNRDWLKLDTPEARAMAGLVARWRPHLDIDVHVTDGVDLAWTVTWMLAEAPLLPAPVDAWQRARWPGIVERLSRAGFGSGPYVSLVDNTDPARGIDAGVFEPRYSTGYFPLRCRPALLVETHARKPYRERVAATRELLALVLDDLRQSGAELVAAVARAEREEVERGRAGAPATAVVLTWRAAAAEAIRVPFRDWTVETSIATGAPYLRYQAGSTRELEVPWLRRVEPERTAPRPRGYLVLPGWPEIERRITDHGLRFERLAGPAEVEVETLRLEAPEFADRPYQGHTRVAAVVSRERGRRRVPAGTLWLPADQPDFEVAVQLLEPEAPDSLLAWGLLSLVFEGKEYIDVYRLDELVRELLEDPAVAAEWDAALAVPEFAADRRARYRWWYRRTPYWDPEQDTLPVLRALTVPAGTP